MLLRLQPDCNSSDPLLGLPSLRSGGWSWSRVCLVSWLVSFCTIVKGGAGSGRGSGRWCQHNSICPCCCQLWRKGSEQGLIISLGETAGDFGRLDTERQFCTHRTSCPHPRLTPNTSYESINIYAEDKWKWWGCKSEYSFLNLVLPVSFNNQACISLFLFDL